MEYISNNSSEKLNQNRNTCLSSDKNTKVELLFRDGHSHSCFDSNIRFVLLICLCFARFYLLFVFHLYKCEHSWRIQNIRLEYSLIQPDSDPSTRH